MLSDWIGDRRVERATRNRLAAFSAGRTVTVPCAFRASARWRTGRLALARGRADWTRRFARKPDLTLARGEATPLHSRPVTGAEALRISPKLTVLAYRRGESTVEFAVRARDLPVLARVLELPAARGRT